MDTELKATDEGTVESLPVPDEIPSPVKKRAKKVAKKPKKATKRRQKNMGLFGRKDKQPIDMAERMNQPVEAQIPPPPPSIPVQHPDQVCESEGDYYVQVDYLIRNREQYRHLMDFNDRMVDRYGLDFIQAMGVNKKNEPVFTEEEEEITRR